MKLLDIIQSASSNLMRNKGRTILTIVAIFIGAFTISLTNGINIGVNDYIDRQVEGVGAKDQLFIQRKVENSMTNDGEPVKYNLEKQNDNVQSSVLNKKDMEKIKEVKGLKDVEALRSPSVNYVEGVNNEKYTVSIMEAIDGVNVDLESGKKVSQDSSQYEINLAPEYIKSLGFKSSEDAVGQMIKFNVPSLATNEEENLDIKIVGVRNKSLMQGGMSLINRQLAEKIASINEKGLPENMVNQYGFFSASVAKGASAKEVSTVKKHLDKLGYSASTLEDQIGQIRSIINAITGVLTLFGAIALLAASFGIINTLYMSVQERTREIGLMKAMGLGSGKVFLIFSIEACLIGFFGSLLGVFAAMGLGNVINQIATESFLKQLTGLKLLQFSFSSSAVIILIVMLIAFLAGTLPARRAAKLDPIEALHYE